MIDATCLALVIGYGAFKALMDTGYLALISSGVVGAAAWPASRYAVAVSLAIMACSLALFAWGHRRPASRLRPATIVAIPLLALIGLGVWAPLADILPDRIALVIAAAAYAFTAIVPNAAWLVPFVALRPRRGFVTLSVSLLVGTSLAWVVGMLPGIARCIGLAALGIASTAFYIRASAGPAEQDAGGEAAEEPRKAIEGPLPTLRYLADPLIAYAVLCTVLGFLTAFQSAGQQVPVHAYPGGAAGIAACGLIVGISVVSTSLDVRKIFGRIFPAVALLAIALPFANQSYSLAFNGLLGFLNSLAGCSIVFLLIEWARSSRHSVIALVGLATFASRLVVVLGLVAGEQLGAQADMDGAVRSLIAVVVAVYLLMCAAAALALTRRSKGSSVVMLKAQPNAPEGPVAAAPPAEEGGAGTATPHQEQPAADPFQVRLDEIAVRDQLTPREADILLLLAQGRSAPHIAQELGISINTVRSYMKGLYPKLGVHSKQELIDLFKG